jgi:hypothetical protein
MFFCGVFFVFCSWFYDLSFIVYCLVKYNELIVIASLHLHFFQLPCGYTNRKLYRLLDLLFVSTADCCLKLARFLKQLILMKLSVSPAWISMLNHAKNRSHSVRPAVPYQNLHKHYCWLLHLVSTQRQGFVREYASRPALWINRKYAFSQTAHLFLEHYCSSTYTVQQYALFQCYNMYVSINTDKFPTTF